MHEYIASHPKTPLSIIEILAQDECADVRFSIAENHHIPVNVLRLLSRDGNSFVACRAKTTLQHLSLINKFCAA